MNVDQTMRDLISAGKLFEIVNIESSEMECNKFVKGKTSCLFQLKKTVCC